MPPNVGPSTANAMPEEIGLPSVPKVTRIPRLAKLVAVLSGPNKRLITVLRENTPLEAQKILTDESKRERLDRGTINKAIFIATESGEGQVVRLLLEKGANINATNADGKTPLRTASDKGDERMVQLLLEKGANTDLDSQADG